MQRCRHFTDKHINCVLHRLSRNQKKERKKESYTAVGFVLIFYDINDWDALTGNWLHQDAEHEKSILYVIQMDLMCTAFRQRAEGVNQYAALLLRLIYGGIVEFKGLTLIYLHSVSDQKKTTKQSHPAVNSNIFI